MKKAAKPVFDHEAFNEPRLERVTRKKLIGGKYATVSMLKLKPGEKRKDPIAELLRIRDEILREEANAMAKAKEDNSAQHRKAA